MYNVRLNVYWPTPEGPKNVQVSRAAASCYAALERCISDLLRKCSMLKEPEPREETCICLTGFVLPIAAVMQSEAKVHQRVKDNLDAAIENDVALVNVCSGLLDPQSPSYRASKGG